MKYNVNINGLEVEASYSDASVENIINPLLQKLYELHEKKGRRILVMLAAPPGAGKSTFVDFLERMAVEQEGRGLKLQSIGMDGFHRRQEYLTSHTTMRDGREIMMVDIKGAPETFDLPKLRASVESVAAGDECGWPVYDRTLHNPVEDAIEVDGDIVILEGNYLLLDEDGWRDLASYADYTISLTADEQVLRNRLIDRKAKSGNSIEDATSFVDFSDMANVRLCLSKSKNADLVIDIDEFN